MRNKYPNYSTVSDTSTAHLSDDGYIRLTFLQLHDLQLEHLDSGLYNDQRLFKLQETSIANIKGYTEWVGSSQSYISIGWDWQLLSVFSASNYSMLGQPFSNIMLINNQQQDLGSNASLSILGIWLNSMNWQTLVFDCIQKKYQ